MQGEAWPEVPLADVLSEPIRNGFSPTESQEWTGVRMLGLGCLTMDGFMPVQLKNAPPSVKRSHPAALRDGDLLISRANTRTLVGLVGIYRDIGNPCIYPDLMMRVRPASNYLSEFLEIVLSSPRTRRRIMAMAQGTSESMVKISGDTVRRLPVPLVPIAAQRWIVDALESLAETERGIEASIAKLRRVRQGTLLSSMASVADAHPRASWVRVPLKDVVPSVEYGISEALDTDARGVPVLRMNNIRDGRAELGELRYSPVAVPDRLYLRPGDVLFNRTNSIEHIGKAAVWRDELPAATFASYLVRLNPDARRVTPEYLVEWLMHPLTRQRVRAISTVAVQQVNVNPSRLRELEIDLPADLAEQRRIVATLEACDEQIEREADELAKLRDLKRGLVDDLFSGKVTVPELAA
ncbi:restriction endonuclease subunit S [Streptomyces kanamyceticus]|uniref:restriction endonuclease subunit S n=1 Tax=Streptomyces kanamyceticus TaxID=1967 RepID=UPI0037DDD058